MGERPFALTKTMDAVRVSRDCVGCVRICEWGVFCAVGDNVGFGESDLQQRSKGDFGEVGAKHS